MLQWGISPPQIGPLRNPTEEQTFETVILSSDSEETEFEVVSIESDTEEESKELSPLFQHALSLVIGRID